MRTFRPRAMSVIRRYALLHAAFVGFLTAMAHWWQVTVSAVAPSADNEMHQPTISFVTSSPTPTSPLFSAGSTVYSRARHDRSGSVIQDMLFAHAYAYNHNLTYGGACVEELPTNDLRRTFEVQQLARHQHLLQGLGLDNMLRFQCPTRRSQLMNDAIYRLPTDQAWTEGWLAYMRSALNMGVGMNWSASAGDEQRSRVAVHIRREDVSPCNPQAFRYSPNAYYAALIHSYAPIDAEVHIFSQRQSFEDWDTFVNMTERNVTLHLDTDLVDTWRRMIHADVLIMSKSSFSFVPALLNTLTRQMPASIVYTPFWYKPLPEWTVAPNTMLHVSTQEMQRLKSQCRLRREAN